MRKLLTYFSVFSLLFSNSVYGQFGEQDSAWINLFDGKTLQGWQTKITGHHLGEDPLNTFSVDHGLLKVRYNNYEQFSGRFGHLFYQTPFSHYALHLEYRFVGKQLKGGPAGWAVRNSGVMLHAQNPQTMTLQQEFPTAIEAQFLGGLSDGKARPTANVCTPGTNIEVEGERYARHCLGSTSDTYNGDQWVNVVVVVLGGGSMTHYVEGKEVLKYFAPSIDHTDHSQTNPIRLEQGYIALQSESHPIDFRQVRLLNLAGCTDKSAKNYAPYLVKSQPQSCQY